MPQPPAADDNQGAGESSVLDSQGRECICGGTQENGDIWRRVPALANKK